MGFLTGTSSDERVLINDLYLAYLKQPSQLASFSDFIKLAGVSPAAEGKDLSDVAGKINRFNYWIPTYYVSSAYLPNEKPHNEFGYYLASGQWFEIPTKKVIEYAIDASYVHQSIITDARQIGEFDMSNFVFHDTSSASLNGISRQRAILSLNEIQRRQERVETGENIANERIKTDIGNIYGTGDIFGHRGGTSLNYATTRWFNEFGLSFGIPKDLLPQPPVYSPEGFILGSQIPIDAIRCIIVQKKGEERIKEWLGKNGLNPKLIIFEAKQLNDMYHGKISLEKDIKSVGVVNLF